MKLIEQVVELTYPIVTICIVINWMSILVVIKRIVFSTNCMRRKNLYGKLRFIVYKQPFQIRDVSKRDVIYVSNYVFDVFVNASVNTRITYVNLNNPFNYLYNSVVVLVMMIIILFILVLEHDYSIPIVKVYFMVLDMCFFVFH